MELVTCCVGGAQKVFDRIEEVDELAKKTMNVVSNIKEKGSDLTNVNRTISPMLKEAPSPATLIKVPGTCKDAAELSHGMMDLTKECCECAAEISQKINDAMDDRCLKLMMIIGGAGDGSSGDDPEAANTEPDCNELRELKDAIVQGNPLTIMKEGFDCVEGIDGKVDVVKTLCSSLINFAESISTITSDILGMNVDKIMGKAAEILRMLKLSEMLAQFSSEMLKLIECMGDVFHVVKDKISEVLPQGSAEFANIVDDMGENLDTLKENMEGKFGNVMSKLF